MAVNGERMNQDTVTVLHVDDNSPLRDLVKTCLERCDSTLSIISEPTATAGLEQLEQRVIDCVVSDYRIVDMDGLEFLKAVRNEYSTLPFILYTGKGSEEIAAKAINAGVDAYYQKAVGSGQYTVLAQHINTLVEKHNAEQRLTHLEQKKHMADGGVRSGDTIDMDEHSESLSMAVVKAVASHENVDPIALTPPLYESIDPEVLDALFAPQSDETDQEAGSVTFTYHGFTITVSSNGQIMLDKSERCMDQQK